MTTSNTIRHPVLLDPVDSPKAWGGEVWLNSTQKDGPAGVQNVPGCRTLDEAVKRHPEILGKWARLLFGDELPIFTKFLRTNFPPLVHMGFKEPVDRKTFLGLLNLEQALLRRLYTQLRVPDEKSFALFQKSYESWAVEQAQRQWTKAGLDEPLADTLQPLLGTAPREEILRILSELRGNRARIVSTLNEVDLREEVGNMLLSEAGVAHAIFGLSHQTHPLDHSKSALQTLFTELRGMSDSGADDTTLEKAVRAADLAAWRARNTGDPKNEAWFPVEMGGKIVLVEPQQTSNITYSFADFYTPFTWKDGLAFRKGGKSTGLGEKDIELYVDSLYLTATPVDAVRCAPKPLEAPSGSKDARLFELVDAPSVWPFFTAHRLDLDGAPGREALWNGAAPDGAFQQLVVIQGEADLLWAKSEKSVLSPQRPAFIPATLEGNYRLASRGKTSLLIFSVPVPRKGAFSK